MSALPALEQGRAKKLVKQRMKNKKRTKTEEEEEEEEGPLAKKRKKRTKIKKNEEEEEDEEDEEDEEQAEEEEEEKEDAKEEEPVAKKPRAATPDTKNKTVSQKRKSKDDMRFNGQNIDAAGPLGTLFKQVAHQNSANVKVQRTNQFRKEVLERVNLKKAADKQKKNKDSEEAKKTAAEQKKNTDSEEDKPQEEVLHGLSIEELKNLKIGDAIKTWYATHSKWFTGNVVKVHRCSVDVAYDDNSTALHRFDGGWIINRVR